MFPRFASEVFRVLVPQYLCLSSMSPLCMVTLLYTQRGLIIHLMFNVLESTKKQVGFPPVFPCNITSSLVFCYGATWSDKQIQLAWAEQNATTGFVASCMPVGTKVQSPTLTSPSSANPLFTRESIPVPRTWKFLRVVAQQRKTPCSAPGEE